jgi:flagellar motor switch protein FliN
MKKNKGDEGPGMAMDDDIEDFQEFEFEGDGKAAGSEGKNASDDGLALPDFDIPPDAKVTPALEERTEKAKVKIKADPKVEEEKTPMWDEGDVKPAKLSASSEFAALAPDVPVSVMAVIGKKTISVGELIRYKIGQTIDLQRPPNETVDLVANGRLMAKGELVDIDGRLGVRIIKLVR